MSIEPVTVVDRLGNTLGNQFAAVLWNETKAIARVVKKSAARPGEVARFSNDENPWGLIASALEDVHGFAKRLTDTNDLPFLAPGVTRAVIVSKFTYNGATRMGDEERNGQVKAALAIEQISGELAHTLLRLMKWLAAEPGAPALILALDADPMTDHIITSLVKETRHVGVIRAAGRKNWGKSIS
jgi:hypothetical protein